MSSIDNRCPLATVTSLLVDDSELDDLFLAPELLTVRVYRFLGLLSAGGSVSLEFSDFVLDRSIFEFFNNGRFAIYLICIWSSYF